MKTVFVFNKDQLGHGDAALGRKTLATLLRKLPALTGSLTLVFLNAGVKLTAADSPVLPELRQLHDHGVEILPCGTCVEFYNVPPAVSSVSNMDDILRALDTADKVVTL